MLRHCVLWQVFRRFALRSVRNPNSRFLMKMTRTVCIRRHISISMGRLYIFIGIFRCCDYHCDDIVMEKWKHLSMFGCHLTQLSHVACVQTVYSYARQ